MPGSIPEPRVGASALASQNLGTSLGPDLTTMTLEPGTESLMRTPNRSKSLRGAEL